MELRNSLREGFTSHWRSKPFVLIALAGHLGGILSGVERELMRL
jgi:hypothetical protein